jgi:sterol desaturase/sphingolipid hydroxylase (fatty acid hydroxylase superfamily)
MLPYEWYTSVVQTLIATGMAVGVIYYVMTKRAFRLFYYSLLAMITGSASTMVPITMLSYAMWVVGHVGVGMFIVSLLFILLKLVKMAADTVPLSVRDL